MDEERCVMCGDVIPEGRQVCTNCEKQVVTKETTRIITLKVTFINDGDVLSGKKQDANFVKGLVKNALNADDVTVENVQDFIIGKRVDES